MPDGAMFVLVAMLNEITWREQTTDAVKVEWSLGNPTTFQRTQKIKEPIADEFS